MAAALLNVWFVLLDFLPSSDAVIACLSLPVRSPPPASPPTTSAPLPYLPISECAI
jgi:hypothetical protein